jgi:hypothetical protein
MELSPQQKKQGIRVSIFSALSGMVVTFLLGLYVGLHPTWIPINSSSTGEDGGPVRLPTPRTERERPHPTTTTQTQPTAK